MPSKGSPGWPSSRRSRDEPDLRKHRATWRYAFSSFEPVEGREGHMSTATVSRRRTRPPARGAPEPRPRERDPGAEPPRTLPHLQALDGLRGVAVLAVVLYHFLPRVAPGGFLGVDLFFVLSGFLITSLLVREWQSSGRIALTAFWARRARRLLPALFLVLAAVGVWALTIPRRPVGHHVAVDGLASFAYAANWHFIASGQS